MLKVGIPVKVILFKRNRKQKQRSRNMLEKTEYLLILNLHSPVLPTVFPGSLCLPHHTDEDLMKPSLLNLEYSAQINGYLYFLICTWKKLALIHQIMSLKSWIPFLQIILKLNLWQCIVTPYCWMKKEE